MHDFGYEGYSPTWVEYEDLTGQIAVNLSGCVGRRIQDINGTVSQDGWGPDWPVVLRFESTAVAINTECGHLWAVDRWLDFPLRPQEPGDPLPIRFESIGKRVALDEILGQELLGVTWPKDRSYGIVQCLLFRFTRSDLRIFDAGDELGLEVLPTQDTASWERIV